MRTLTLPEGIQITPPPVMYEAPQPPQSVGSKSFLVLISTVLGTVIAASSIIGGLGNAFFVSRPEFSAQRMDDERNKIMVAESVKRIDAAMARQEEALAKLTDTMDTLRKEMITRRR